MKKFFKAGMWYNLVTNKGFRMSVVITIFLMFILGYYSFYYNRSNKGDVQLKYEIETKNMNASQVKDYMEKNGFKFMSGNPIYASNRTLINDGVNFRRYIKDNGKIEYQYCNTNVYPTCINVDILISELPKYYDSNSSSYQRILNIYEDYALKLDQLNLTGKQVNLALDYYYNELYNK